MYYADKMELLKDIFGSEKISLRSDRLIVDERTYPIVDDVIIQLDPSQYPPALNKRINAMEIRECGRTPEIAGDIQFTFGREWQKFPEILPEHEQEFAQYFDLINLAELKNSRVCDLGCGIGRWSYFLKDKCRELVLVDFSEAIFVARRNLGDIENAVFIMADIRSLALRDDFCDFLFCLGVLHHLPANALDEVRSLKKYAPTLLIYLYYALDNRPFYFRSLFFAASILRKLVSRVKNPIFRSSFTVLAAAFLYMPFIMLGKVLRPFGISGHVPLYEVYNGKGLKRIRQDVYDRFFTGIEQRFSKKQIMELEHSFGSLVVSDRIPYWHFICQRKGDV